MEFSELPKRRRMVRAYQPELIPLETLRPGVKPRDTTPKPLDELVRWECWE